MNFSDWLQLTDNNRDNMCQKLNPSEEWGVFKSVESEFIAKFGNQDGIGKVFCGIAPGVGPCNAIVVEILPDRPRTRLPKKFLGFPVVRTYHQK